MNYCSSLVEAPKRPCCETEEPSDFPSNDVDRPKDAPSRDRALGHGSTRFSAYHCHPNRVTRRSGQAQGRSRASLHQKTDRTPDEQELIPTGSS
jgi:hypothetical protein